MFYPYSWDASEIDEYSPSQDLNHIARLLQSASREYYVKLQPISLLHQNRTTQETCADSYTKLLAFNLTSLDRVLTIDTNSVVLQNLDELFLLQPAPVAMPYVYWGSPTGWSFSSQMMLITPSTTTFSQIESAIKGAKADEYDMDILNSLFRNRILRIPERPYNLLSGEFRRTEHKQYLGPTSQKAYAKPWDPDAILAEARVLHFSDWPVPQPWVRASQEVLNKYMPKCRKSEWFGASNCRDRAVWLKLYVDFEVRRNAVCGVGFELQSEVLPPDSVYRHGRWFHPDEAG